jgi:hypothetical protein
VKRSICLVTVLALALAGCGTGANRAAAKSVLLALTVATAAIAAGAAVKSRSVRDDLRRDVDAGTLSGRQFNDRDATGNRWNRISKASAFGSVVFLLGMGAVWEMGVGDRIQYGPREWTPAEDPKPIFSPPGATFQSRASAR